MAPGSRPGRVFAVWTLLFVVVIAAVAVSPQEALKLPDGATLVVQLQQSVRADRAKPGEQVRAKLLAPMLENGRIVLPTGATVLGVVVEAEPLALPKSSRLMIRFQQARWKEGTADLNAYMTKYLVMKQTYSYESREFCPPVQRFQLQSQFQQTSKQQGQKPPTQPPPPPPPAPRPPRPQTYDDLCHRPLGTRTEKEPLIFSSPILRDIILRKLDTPPGATMLESDKTHVSLPKGMIWEIRHAVLEASAADTLR